MKKLQIHYFIIIIFFSIFVISCPNPGEIFPQDRIRADIPTNANAVETNDSSITITWDGNINEGSYAICESTDNIRPTENTMMNPFFVNTNSYSTSISTDVDYYFWIIPTNIDDSQPNKIDDSMLNDAVLVHYIKETLVNEEYPEFNLYYETGDNETPYIELSDNDIIASNKLIIRGNKLSEEKQAYYSFKINDSQWSDNIRIYNNEDYNAISISYYFPETQYGKIQIKAFYLDEEPGEIITITLDEKKTVSENSTLKDSSDNQIIDGSIYNEDIIITSDYPIGYPINGTFKVCINDDNNWQTFSDNANKKHTLSVNIGESLEITKLEIKYIVTENIYESKVHTFEYSNLPITFKLDKKPPTFQPPTINIEPYSFEIYWEKPSDEDLDKIELLYSTDNGVNYNSIKTYTADSTIPDYKTEYISTDSDYVDVKIIYTDKIGNFSVHEEENLKIDKNLTHICSSPNGSSTNIGGTWETTTELQSAMDFAYDNNIPEVWLKNGTYYPPSGKYYFNIKEGVSIIGGFNGSETSIPTNFIFESENKTILSSYSYHIIYNVDEKISLNSKTRVERITFKNGNANGTYSIEDRNPVQTASGGAIFLKNNNSPIFINCEFESNYANKSGGAVYISNSYPKFINCIFDSNSTGHSSNYPYDSVPYAYGGGAIYSIFSDFEIINCLFKNNSANSYGAAISVDKGSSFNSINSAFYYNNTAYNNNDKIIFYYNFNGNPLLFDNSIINTDHIIYNENISNLEEHVTTNNCTTELGTLIDMGDNQKVQLDDFDIDHDGNTMETTNDLNNNPRIVNNTVDIGPIETQ